MNADQTQVQQKETSVAIMTRVSQGINEKIETWQATLGHRNKSTFVEHAILDYIRRLETSQIAGSTQSQN